MENNIKESIDKMNKLMSYDRSKTINEQNVLTEEEQILVEIGLGRILKFFGIVTVYKWVVRNLFGGSESKLKDKLGVDDEKGFFDKLKSDGDVRDTLSSLYDKQKDFSDFDYSDLPDDGFYSRVLSGIGAPKTGNNMALMYAWRKAESGNAKHNPFNTMYDGGLSISNYNQQGVKNYGSTRDGVAATVSTLEMSYYRDVVKALRNDESPYYTARKIGDSPWGTTTRLLTSTLDSIRNGGRFVTPIQK